MKAKGDVNSTDLQEYILKEITDLLLKNKNEIIKRAKAKLKRDRGA